MITINTYPIICRIIQRRYCATITVTNYEKLPKDIIEDIQRISFVVNTKNYPDLICVVPNNVDQDNLWAKLVGVSSFCKVE